MFQRLTEGARRVVRLAQDEARAMGRDYVGTEHLLIGLACEEEGVGSHVLRDVGIDCTKARQGVLRVMGPPDDGGAGRIVFTPRCKRVLELALREAMSLGHNEIGTEHLLLGLVREETGVGHAVIAAAGASATLVRERVLARLEGPAGELPHLIRPASVERAAPPRRAGVDWPAALLDAAASFAERRDRAPAVRVTLTDGERLDVESIRPGVVGEIIGFVVYDAQTGTRLVLVRPEAIARADVTVDPGGRGFLGLRPEPPEP